MTVGAKIEVTQICSKEIHSHGKTFGDLIAKTLTMGNIPSHDLLLRAWKRFCHW
jgi:hypothetical protein